MEITVHNCIIQVAVVTTDERIDVSSAPNLRERLNALVAEGASRFVIDLSAVPFIDSAGMGMLVSLLKHARVASGEVVLVWPTEDGPRKILQLTKLDRVFPMADTVGNALRTLTR
ncbi:MAG: STAS domain-containing protein [Chloroflexales bacterium]|jgi:anti-sigma B factor antagonist